MISIEFPDRPILKNIKYGDGPAPSELARNHSERARKGSELARELGEPAQRVSEPTRNLLESALKVPE
jgi:hypothetical protein